MPKSNYYTNETLEGVKVLGGIDTLYFFIDTKMTSSEKLYHNLWDTAVLGGQIDNYTFKNFSGKSQSFVGAWYSRQDCDGLTLYRIGFKDPNKQKQVDNIYIQLEAGGIYTYGLFELIKIVFNDIKDLIDLDLCFDSCKASRVDLNAFVRDYDFGFISSPCFRTRSKSSELHQDYHHSLNLYSKSFVKCLKTETLYLGSAKSPIRLKIYNKLVELEKLIPSYSKSAKQAYFALNKMWGNELWNIEFRLKRQVLKDFGISSLGDLFLKAKSVFTQLMHNYSFLGYETEKYEKYKKNKNQSDLLLHPIWTKIINDYSINQGGNDMAQRIKRESKGHNKDWFIQQLYRLARYKYELRIEMSNQDILSIFNDYEKIKSMIISEDEEIIIDD